MIYKVALVDDEQSAREGLRAYLQEYGQEKCVDFTISEYENGADFLEKDVVDFDIVFLDINMPDVNGLEAAKRIRKMNSAASIIFCTNYAQYALKGYEVEAVGFLVKPVTRPSFWRNIDRAISILKHKQSQKLLIKTANGQEVVMLFDVVYMEVKIHNLFIYVLNGTGVDVIRTRGSMREMCAKLESKWFARCSVCYLVNLSHVKSIVKTTVKCRGGVVLPISRKFLKEFNDKFMAYLTEYGVMNV